MSKLPDRPGQKRCQNCEHLESMHNDKGCQTWNLGCRAVPIFLCACRFAVTSSSSNPTFPTIKFNIPTPGGTGLPIQNILNYQNLKINANLFSTIPEETIPEEPPQQENTTTIAINYFKQYLNRHDFSNTNFTPHENREIISAINSLILNLNKGLNNNG